MSFPCSQCHKGFCYQKNLVAHQKVCRGEKSEYSGIKCSQCDKIFRRTSAFQEHVEKEHNLKLEIEELFFNNNNRKYEF